MTTFAASGSTAARLRGKLTWRFPPLAVPGRGLLVMSDKRAGAEVAILFTMTVIGVASGGVIAHSERRGATTEVSDD